EDHLTVLPHLVHEDRQVGVVGVGDHAQPLVPGEENEVVISDFRFCSRELATGSRLRLTIRAAWSPLILPASDGLTSHPAVTLVLVHRAEDPAVLTLPNGTPE
ncbi:MAG: hypothetical protein ACKOJI_06700, partial [Phycisphaerales bacterium]